MATCPMLPCCAGCGRKLLRPSSTVGHLKLASGHWVLLQWPPGSCSGLLQSQCWSPAEQYHMASYPVPCPYTSYCRHLPRLGSTWTIRHSPSGPSRDPCWHALQCHTPVPGATTAPMRRPWTLWHRGVSLGSLGSLLEWDLQHAHV